MMDTQRLRRSVLYMPGANTRALEKAVGLDCDGLIFDLEDAVAPDVKAAARANVVHSLQSVDYGYRERIVRVNGLDTPWGHDDVAALAQLDVDAVLFPKIESADMVLQAQRVLEQAFAQRPANKAAPALWIMIESPTSILRLDAICDAHQELAVLVMGTSDLVRDLRAQHQPSREPLLYSLSAAVTAARAYGLEVLDGVHLDFRNAETFLATCEQGRAMGFDGRSLIHPGQIEVANEIYGFSEQAIEHARRVIDVWQIAQQQGKGVVELDGQLIENLHAAEAARLLALAETLAQRTA